MSERAVVIFKFWISISFAPWQGDLCRIIFPPAARAAFIMSSIIHGRKSVFMGCSSDLQEEERRSQAAPYGDWDTRRSLGPTCECYGFPVLCSKHQQGPLLHGAEFALIERDPASVSLGCAQTVRSLEDRCERQGCNFTAAERLPQAAQTARPGGGRRGRHSPPGPPEPAPY